MTLATTPEERDLIRAQTLRRLHWREQGPTTKSYRRNAAMKRQASIDTPKKKHRKQRRRKSGTRTGN